MDTRLFYQTDSYLREFTAKVIGVNPDLNAVILDQTAFYPGGGGQPCDFGVISVDGVQYTVDNVQKTPDGVFHHIDSQNDLPLIDSQADGRIDWAHRYQLMRTHTALHILCGVIFRDYGAQVTGGAMEPLKGRMDFEFESLHKGLIQEIETAVNLEINRAHPIRVAILPREEAFRIPDLIRTKINLLPPGIQTVRTVNIEGLDLQADGGTHVHNTSEVGKIHVIDYKSKGKINKRIYIDIE